MGDIIVTGSEMIVTGSEEAGARSSSPDQLYG
jgi:hypothetical protein